METEPQQVDILEKTNKEEAAENTRRSDQKDRLIHITVAMYDLFLANGALGMDAKNVYEHLIYTARRQKTNQVWATVSYLARGLNMGEKRVRAAKKFLKDKDLIDYVQRPPVQGEPQFGKTYIRLKYLWRHSTLERHLEEDDVSDYGLTDSKGEISNTSHDRQMLKAKNKNALNKQYSSTFDVHNYDFSSVFNNQIKQIRRVPGYENLENTKALQELLNDLMNNGQFSLDYLFFVAEKEPEPSHFIYALRKNLHWEAFQTEMERRKREAFFYFCPACNSKVSNSEGICGTCELKESDTRFPLVVWTFRAWAIKDGKISDVSSEERRLAEQFIEYLEKELEDEADRE